ncbi:MAG: hypothetical protein K9K93_03380, partial [Acholeplasmataceae bacterium]|nr:hypothetical protein [Acholeplasmataceae bacterium]
MSLEPGRINRLQVRRQTDIGFMLFQSGDEVFLHFNESDHKALKVNDTVEAFLYFDFKGRLSATLHTPLATIDQAAMLSVCETVSGLGVFVDIGISKDILLSKDDLPSDKALWPRPDDRLYCKIKAKGRLLMAIVPPSEIPMPLERPELGDEIEGIVQMIGKEG